MASKKYRVTFQGFIMGEFEALKDAEKFAVSLCVYRDPSVRYDDRGYNGEEYVYIVMVTDDAMSTVATYRPICRSRHLAEKHLAGQQHFSGRRVWRLISL